MRARMALLTASIGFDALEISLKEKPVAMLAVSSKGTVPVLVLSDGRVIEESLDIMRWAFEPDDPTGWWRRAQTDNNRALIADNDGAFKQQLDRYKYPQRLGPIDPALSRDEALAGMLRVLEERLAARAWLGADAPCAADLAIFPFVRQFRAVDAAWFDAQPLPATQRWLQIWLQGQPFDTCMKRLPTGVRLEF